MGAEVLEDSGVSSPESGVSDPAGKLVASIESLPPESNADAMIQTGQIMYSEGKSNGMVKGLLVGALIGAGLLLLVR
jgi:hypothetical protein